MGLFFGFLVRDTLTKLWKAVDLGRRGEGSVWHWQTVMFIRHVQGFPQIREKFVAGGWVLLHNIIFFKLNIYIYICIMLDAFLLSYSFFNA